MNRWLMSVMDALFGRPVLSPQESDREAVDRRQREVEERLRRIREEAQAWLRPAR